MQRRTALTVLTGIGGIAAAPALVKETKEPGQPVRAGAAAPLPEELLFFSDAENALLDRLTEMIIPADERSGGAHAGKVSLYIDREAAYSQERVQDQWRSSLQLVEEETKRRFGKSFLECDAVSQDQLMSEWASGEQEMARNQRDRGRSERMRAGSAPAPARNERFRAGGEREPARTEPRDPKAELQSFFVRLKRATTSAYYSCEVGLLQELGYKGNDVLDSFPGCTDPNCKYHNR